MFDFKDQVIIVTGAGGNLGNAVVKAMLHGYGTVCGLYHRKASLTKELQDAVKDERLYLYEGIDVTDREGLLSLGKKIQSDFGKVDVLVNTVGGFTAGETVYELAPATWEKMLDLNVHSFLNTTAAFVPLMLDGGRGKIVSVGSKSALDGTAKTGAYAAAKGALLRLTESLAKELMDENIQVNCVLPGTMDTPENREAMPKANYDHWVKLEQVADAILYLSSSSADAISGAALPVYGQS